MIASSLRRIVIVFLLACTASALQAQTVTIRIRFVNGKSGKPLHLKSYEHSDGSAEADGSYVIDHIDRDSMTVTFKKTKNFFFRSEYFEPCDSKTPKTDQPKYDLQQIVEHGVVAPNYCGKSQAQPSPGVLVIYSRHEHWWQVTGRIAKGLLICA